MSALGIDCQLNTEVLPAANQPRLVYLLVEIQTGQGSGASAPVNLSLVVDASDSMHIRLVNDEQFDALAEMGLMREVMADGVPAWQIQDIPRHIMDQFPRKVDFVVTSMRTVLEQLRPQDQVSLVAFAGHAQTLLPSTKGSDKQKLLAAIKEFDQITLGDDTYMGRGIELGYGEMRNGHIPERVDRMILLTDGFTRDVAECWQWASRAQVEGFSISTMGLGGEFNEELLIPMAEQSGGHAYFIEEPNTIPEVFREELNAAQTIGYRDTELKLQLTPGVELRQIYKVKPMMGTLDPGINRGGSYNMRLGDLEYNNPPAMLLELIVPPRQPGRFRIAQVLLSTNPIAEQRQNVRQDIVLEYTSDVSRTGQVKGRVMNFVERATAFKLQTRALQDAAAGDMSSATKKLQAAATRLLDMGEVEMARAVQEQANALDQSSQLDANATKKLRYETRKLTQKLD